MPSFMSSRPLIALLLSGSLIVAGCDRQSPPVEQADSNAQAMPDEMPAGPAGPGAVATIDRGHKGAPAPSLGFVDPDGRTVTIADFRGQPVLVNLWATWCAPCIAEMPTLDAVAARRKGQLTVLTIAQDLDGKAKVLPYFAKARFTALRPYIDAQAGLSLAYQANLPTTILYDSAGREVWRVSGGRDWSNAESARLIAEAG